MSNVVCLQKRTNRSIRQPVPTVACVCPDHFPAGGFAESFPVFLFQFGGTDHWIATSLQSTPFSRGRTCREGTGLTQARCKVRKRTRKKLTGKETVASALTEFFQLTGHVEIKNDHPFQIRNDDIFDFFMPADEVNTRRAT